MSSDIWKGAQSRVTAPWCWMEPTEVIRMPLGRLTLEAFRARLSGRRPQGSCNASQWVVEVISHVYACKNAQMPSGVPAHFTRGVDASWALFKGVSMEYFCWALWWAGLPLICSLSFTVWMWQHTMSVWLCSQQVGDALASQRLLRQISSVSLHRCIGSWWLVLTERELRVRNVTSVPWGRETRYNTSWHLTTSLLGGVKLRLRKWDCAWIFMPRGEGRTSSAAASLALTGMLIKFFRLVSWGGYLLIVPHFPPSRNMGYIHSPQVLICATFICENPKGAFLSFVLFFVTHIPCLTF